MKQTTHFLVGLFVILGMAAVLFLALRASNLTQLGGGASYTVQAYFDDLGGLKEGAAVRSAGVLVGRVSAIKLDAERYQADVSISLEQGIPFPADSSLQILTAGLLGEKYLGITPGADIENLKAGDRIVRTQSAVVLENLISQFIYNRGSDSSNESESK